MSPLPTWGTPLQQPLSGGWLWDSNSQPVDADSFAFSASLSGKVLLRPRPLNVPVVESQKLQKGGMQQVFKASPRFAF